MPKTPSPPKKPAPDLADRYRTHPKDTGSPEVQITLLTQRLNALAGHLKTHPKDFDSKRGLLILVGKRRRLLNYLARHNQAQYQALIADLGLRK